MFEGEIGRMENFGEIQIFSPRTHKKVLSKMERKLNGKIRHYFWTKMPICSCTWACPRCSFSFFFFFLFLSSGRCLFLKIFIYFLFFLIYWASFPTRPSSSLFFFDLLGRLPTHPGLIFFFFFIYLLVLFFFFF